LALIAIVLGAGSMALLPAIGVAVAAIACRMVLLRQVERAYDLPPQPYWLVPARDLLSFALFVLSFLGRDVHWKGRRYRAVASADRG
jgi:ceramide glucosyltransferase